MAEDWRRLPDRSLPALRELAERPQWVLWKAEQVADGKGGFRLTKIPYQARTGRKADSMDPATWATFDECLHACKIEGAPWDGVGFVFTKDDPYAGIDLDKCYHDGQLDKWAAEIVRKLGSYTEITPSGTGLHVLVKAEIRHARRRKGAFEVYTEGRYFTVTGAHLGGAAEAIFPRQVQLDDICFQIFADETPAPGAPPPEQAPRPRTRARAAPTPPVSEDKPEETAASEAGPSTRPGEPDKLSVLIEQLTPYVAADAQPNQDKLLALFDNSPVVKQTWDHTRKDSTSWSGSEYDLALANFFMAAGWSNVEIMRGLIAHRRTAGLDPKLRADYFARTIIAAQRNRMVEEAQEKLAPGNLERMAKTDRRAAVLDSLSIIYDLPFKDVVKYVGEEPVYAIATEKGTVKVNVETLMMQTGFRRAFAAVTDIIPKKAKDGAFDRRVQAIMQVARYEQMGIEASDEGQVRIWVQNYLRERPDIGAFSDEKVILGHPFRDAGLVWIVGDDLSLWLMRSAGVRLPASKRGTMMRVAGCIVKNREVFKEDGGRTTRSCWGLPKEWIL